MLVYDITNTKSFDNLENWLRRIQEHGKANVEKMILGNKCDLEEKRLISKVTKENLALEIGTKYKRSEDLESNLWCSQSSQKLNKTTILSIFFLGRTQGSVFHLVFGNIEDTIICFEID